ncbi:hypothetical protein [Thermogutta sp.]|uniref:hypothetical protein n=1 Tax=Thermogutta sp. TaxID=1962930 RepID=UPI00322051A6
MVNFLHNGDFERGWEGVHHRCIVFPVGGAPYEREAGEMACPEGWTAWYRHGLPVEHDPQNGVGWSAPEIRPCGLTPDPRRVCTGNWGCVVFTFSRIHDAGLFQQVAVAPGTRLRLSAWAHAWSNVWGSPHESDPRWSEGSHVGYNAFFAEEGTPGLDDADRNFTFWVGIDPTGGTNPYAPTVVWGKGAHIYNAYYQVPAVETTALADRVTVFLRSRTLWPFKHNDAYWDDVLLQEVSWGLPREQYARVYVLLPPSAGSDWVRAILDSGAWDRERWTIGGSADDAGIGALLNKTVIAINPDLWPGKLEDFFQRYYPGTRFIALTAATPEELRQKLRVHGMGTAATRD